MTAISSQHPLPFVDLHAQYCAIKREIDAAIAAVIKQSAFVRGRHVEDFEANFAAAIGTKHCISCGNGTDALYLSMRSLGVQKGDEVLVPAHSWISTAETVTQAGGKVVFCDTLRDTFTVDPEDIKRKTSDRTVGIIPVHLFGQAADMEPIVEHAKKHNLWILEDCAQAHLAKYKGQSVGTFGQAASFSFYPGKNLGAMGDAGAVTTNNDELARKIAMLARHGGLTKGDHQIEGVNSRMDGLQAAILNVKLPHLANWTAKRQERANEYGKLLEETPGLLLPSVGRDRSHAYHLYVIQHNQRDELADYLKSFGVPTVINYPVSLPFLPAYSHFRHAPSDFPVAHGHQSRILSLPIFPEMTNEQINQISSHINTFCRTSPR